LRAEGKQRLEGLLEMAVEIGIIVVAGVTGRGAFAAPPWSPQNR
jgi:hypothetical protein